GPAFEWPPMAAAQAEQIGIGHDGMWFFPFGKKRSDGRSFGSSRHGLLALNNEFGTNTHVLGKPDRRVSPTCACCSRRSASRS
ncbi:MAG: hypothetical protein ACREQ1_03330, partial [Woeseiaceae bacterium]